MKKLFFFLVAIRNNKRWRDFLLLTANCLLPAVSSAQYSSQNMTLLAHWDTAATIAEPIYNIRYNSVWGWVDPQDNKEYAIIGSSDGTYFIDVTVPTALVVCDYVAGRRDSCIWREYKTYQNYLYAVSDDAAPNSLQIINMDYLPDSVHVEYDNDVLIQRSHTIFIDGNNLYCGSVFLPNNGGHSNMAVFSLANPTTPVLLRRLEQDFPSNDNVHDMYVRNDTIYASSSYSGLFIYKLTANDTLSLIGSLTNYLEQGYNHSSALTADSKTLIFTDEVPENLSVKSLDVSTMGNLTVLDYFKSTPATIATPHNPFIRNGDNSRVVIAYYQDGVQIFDITNPSNVTRTGFFDTAPANCPACPNTNYSGCWGAYIDLPSGIILAGDMQDGLFVLDASAAMGIIPECMCGENPIVNIFPNPSISDFTVDLYLPSAQNINYELTDITGKTIISTNKGIPSGNTKIKIAGKNLSAGAYFLRFSVPSGKVVGEEISVTQKLIKIN